MLAYGRWRRLYNNILYLVEGTSLDESQRIEYFRKWPPPPRWLTWMIEVIWDLNPEDFDDDDDYWPYFRRTKALGFGGEDDYQRDWDGWDETL